MASGASAVGPAIDGGSVAGPRPAGERLVVLDALRGFALFGILVANILYWSGWAFMTDAQQAALAGKDAAAAADFLHLFLIDGKFYTLFSFLFGIGFALQLARLEGRGIDGIRLYRRRLLLLLAIGIVHMVFIWDGDILTLYALLGLCLPLARGWSERRLLTAAAALLLVPIPGFLIFHAAGIPPDLSFEKLGDSLAVTLGGTPKTPIAWLQREDAGAYWSWVMGGWPYRFATIFETWRIPKVLAIMLLGLWAGRRLIGGRLLENRRLLRRTLLWGAAIGFPANLAYAWSGGIWQDDVEGKMMATIAHALGVVPLAMSYAAGFALLWTRTAGALRWLAPAGRMALTNYLSHSFIGIGLFYGVGLGLVGRLPPPAFFAIAILIFVLQLLLSHMWLKRFDQGPMERLWRLGTYGRPVKPQASPAAS